MTPADLLVIVGMSLAVYVPKALPLVVASESLTSRLRSWLQYVAPALLGALIAPSIVAPAGQLAAPAWDQAGYLVAFLVAILTRRMVPSLAAGLATIVAVTLLRR